MRDRKGKVIGGIILSMLIMSVLAGPIVRSLPIIPVAALLLGGVVGGVVGYMWSQVTGKVSVPAEAANEVDNQISLLHQYTDNIVFSIWDVNNYIPRMSNYYIRWAEAAASTDCVGKVVEFENSTVQKTAVEEIKSLFNNVTTQILKTYAYHFSTLKMLAYRKYLLSGAPDYIHGSGYAVKKPGIVYLGPPWSSWYNKFKEGSSCFLGVRIVYTDGSSEDFVFGTFSLGRTEYEYNSDVVFDLLRGLSEGKINNKTISDWSILNYCRGINEVDEENTVYYMPPYGVQDAMRDFITLMAGMYREVKNAYEMYCTMTNLWGGYPVPPPSVVLPFAFEDLEKLPFELRLQIYYAYLSALMNVNWSIINNVTERDVYTTYPGVIITDMNTSIVPLVLPFNVPCIVGYPYPLFGTIFVDGVIITLPTLQFDPSTHDSIQINNTVLYWVLNKFTGEIIGVGVDLDGDSTPDVYSEDYVGVKRITVWDPQKQTWTETNSTTFGPKTVSEWVRDTNIEEYLKRLEEENQKLQEKMNDILETLRKFLDIFKLPSLNINKWVLIAAGALVLLIILVAVVGGGKGKVVIVGRG